MIGFHPAERESLHTAIERLYTTFKHYPLRIQVAGCDHCVSPTDNTHTHARPLQELTPDDLSRYAWKAMTTWGDRADFRHFLPRLLELSAFDDLGMDQEILFGKLRYAQWRTWPQHEQDAVGTFLMALWRMTLTAFPALPPSPWDSATCLCCLAQAVDDLSPYLNTWRDLCASTLPALRHLVEFLDQNITSLEQKRRLWNAWWKERKDAMVQVVRWLLDPTMEAMLEQAFFEHVAEPMAEDLSRVVATLSSLRLQW